MNVSFRKKIEGRLQTKDGKKLDHFVRPLLDANGWAVNTRARINVPFGAALTGLAKLPVGAKRSLHDPYAEKKRPWGLLTILLILLAVAVWYYCFAA